MPVGGILTAIVIARAMAVRRKRKKAEKKARKARAQRAQKAATAAQAARGTQSTPPPATARQHHPRRAQPHAAHIQHENVYPGALAREEGRIERRALHIKF